MLKRFVIIAVCALIGFGATSCISIKKKETKKTIEERPAQIAPLPADERDTS